MQLAFGADDDEMCCVLEDYFKKAFGSEEAAREEIRRQLVREFPKNDEEKQLHKQHDLEIKKIS